MNILLSAGEVFGDIVGASIAMELRRRDPSIRIWGLGGARMQASGVEVRTETNGLGRIGVSESFSAILPFARAFKDIRRQVKESAPDLAILVANAEVRDAGVTFRSAQFAIVLAGLACLGMIVSLVSATAWLVTIARRKQRS